MKIIDIKNNREFTNLIKSKKTSIIYFYSDLFVDVNNKVKVFVFNTYDISINFYFVNIKDNKDLFREQDITTYPIFRIYKDSDFIKEIFCNYENLDDIMTNFYK